MHIVRHPAFRWAICIILLAAMAYQLWVKSNHFTSFQLDNWSRVGWYLVIVLVLMPMNWWLETAKWHGFLSVHAGVPITRAFRAVTGGIALSLFTPNRIGEYGGRLMFMPYSMRWPVVFSTLMGSISQNLVAFSIGIGSFLLLFESSLLIRVIFLLVFILTVSLYFQMPRVVRWICKLKWHRFFRKISDQLGYMEDYKKGLLLKSVLLAFLRYMVYTIQFVLLLKGLEPQASAFQLFLGISCLYLFHTLIPMPPVADVLARTNLALILWSGAGMSELSISLASFIVWVINLLIPAILGSVAIGTIKLKKSFNTHDPHLSPSYEPAIPDRSKNN